MTEAWGLVDVAWVIEFSSLLTLLTGEAFLGNLNYKRPLINPGHQQMFCRLVKMTIGLIHATYSLKPKWQSCKTDSLFTLIIHRFACTYKL